MQDVAQGTVSDSEKDNQNCDCNSTTADKWQTCAAADLQEDKFSTSSEDCDSEEDDISEVWILNYVLRYLLRE